MGMLTLEACVMLLGSFRFDDVMTEEGAARHSFLERLKQKEIIVVFSQI